VVTISPLAGQPAPNEMLVDAARLEREYYARTFDRDDPGQLVRFGTENIYKIYAESFESQAHLDAIVTEALEIVRGTISRS